MYRNRKSPHVVPRDPWQRGEAPRPGERRRGAGLRQGAYAATREDRGRGADDGDRQHAQRVLRRRSRARDGHPRPPSTRSLLDLQAAGCTTSFSLDEAGDDALPRQGVRLWGAGARTADVFEGVRVPTFVHLCFGYPGGMALQHQFAYPELLAELLRDPASAASRSRFALAAGFDPASSQSLSRPPSSCSSCANRPRRPRRRRQRRGGQGCAAGARASRPATPAAGARLRSDDHQPPRSPARNCRSWWRPRGRVAPGALDPAPLSAPPGRSALTPRRQARPVGKGLRSASSICR